MLSPAGSSRAVVVAFAQLEFGAKLEQTGSEHCGSGAWDRAEVFNLLHTPARIAGVFEVEV